MTMFSLVEWDISLLFHYILQKVLIIYFLLASIMNELYTESQREIVKILLKIKIGNKTSIVK